MSRSDSALPKTDVLKAMPRRPPMAVEQISSGPPPLVSKARPPASFPSTFGRTLRWSYSLIICMGGILYDRMRRRATPRNRGIRLRRMFERMGGTAVKLGQQMAMRVDLLPHEMCEEFGKLLDSVPPMEIETSIAIIEREIGRPLGEIFEQFDPVPIGSASIACVYQAVLKTGEKVAVKVQRPAIARHFATDLRVLDWFTRIPEILSVVRPGFFKYLRSELRSMLYEELSFTTEARYQTLFRVQAKQARLDWLRAPKVFRKLSGQEVLVTELVSGLWCKELLAVSETQDPEGLAKLRELEIEPKKIAARLLHSFWWSYFEGLFFHADPHPANIVIGPKNQIIMLDFGSCGVASRRHRSCQWAMLERMMRNDVSGMADVAMHVLEPLPHIDVLEFRKRVEATFHSQIFALRDKTSEWWERTTMGLWLSLLEATREYQLPLNLEVVRYFRASLLADTLVYRLDPKLKVSKHFRKYQRDVISRKLRAMKRGSKGSSLGQQQRELMAKASDAADRLRFGAWQADMVLSDSPVQLTSAVNKSAYAAQMGIRVVVQTAFVGVAVAIGMLGYRLMKGYGISGLSWSKFIVHDVLMHPVTLVLLPIILLIAVRRIAFRLNDYDSFWSQSASRR